MATAAHSFEWAACLLKMQGNAGRLHCFFKSPARVETSSVVRFPVWEAAAAISSVFCAGGCCCKNGYGPAAGTMCTRLKRSKAQNEEDLMAVKNVSYISNVVSNMYPNTLTR